MFYSVPTAILIPPYETLGTKFFYPLRAKTFA